MKNQDILLDAIAEVFYEEWQKENPYTNPKDYQSCYHTFCMKRIKALLESIKDKVD
jgi:hypothetical protein